MIIADHLEGAPVHEALLVHVGNEGGAVHAVRPAADHYLLALPDQIAARPAVRLVLHHCATRRGAHYVIPAALAGRIVAAIGADDIHTLAAIAADAIKKENAS